MEIPRRTERKQFKRDMAVFEQSMEIDVPGGRELIALFAEDMVDVRSRDCQNLVETGVDGELEGWERQPIRDEGLENYDAGNRVRHVDQIRGRSVDVENDSAQG